MPRPNPDLGPEHVPYDDVDDVIGVAEELKQRDTNQMSVAELRGVAQELDLDGKYVDRAVRALGERRQQEAAKEKEKLAKRTLYAKVAAGVSAGLMALSFVFGMSTKSDLESAHSLVEQKRAQVVNVVQRQQATELRLKDSPESSERAAELAGSENRVRIERKRYDEAAAAYNEVAGGPFDSTVALVFGFPRSVPLSPQVTSWN